MSLARAIEKIPHVVGKEKRGLLVALEGPTQCNIHEVFNKILPDVESNTELYTFSFDFDWNNPDADFRRAIAQLYEAQDSIVAHLKRGKLVVVTNHTLSVLAAAWRNNVFKCRKMQDVAGARILLAAFRDIIIPDITFMCMPSIETMVNRLVKHGFITDEDAYMYSEYRVEAQAYNKMANYLDDVYDLSANPIGTESEMLQRIVLSSVTDCFKPIKFYYA
jgi:hypothetical protein